MHSRVVLASDHAGFSLKEGLKKYLQEQKIDVVDVGTMSEDPVDYPPIMRKAAAAVLEYSCLGIIIGGSGNGEAIAANKVLGIRAAVCYSEEITKLARAHNDANIMSLGARFTSIEDAKNMVHIFLATDFEGGRHTSRVLDLDTPLL